MSAPDLSFLLAPLPVGDDPSLDAADPEFVAICELANRGDLAGAATRIEPLLTRGVYDLRLVAILFVRAFEAGGWAELERALRGVLALVGENREAFGPHARRDAQLDKRLAWTFERIGDLHAYHTSKADSTYARWSELESVESLEAAMQVGRAVSAALGERGYQEAGQRFGAVSRIVAERVELARKGGLSKSAQPAPDAPAPSSSPTSTSAPSQSANDARGRPTATLVVTHHFLALSDRLQAFGELVSRGDHERAAIVAESVLAELDAFDPRKHFPDLVAPFYGDMTRNIAKLAPHLEREASPRIEMLRQLLRIDLGRFMERE